MGGGGNLETQGNQVPKLDKLKGEILKDAVDTANAINQDKVNSLKVKYKIGSGDTLGKIAQAFGTTTEQLQKDNKIQDANKIFAGKTIEINKPGISNIPDLPVEQVKPPVKAEGHKKENGTPLDRNRPSNDSGKTGTSLNNSLKDSAIAFNETKTDEMTFDEKYENAKLELSRVESAIKKEINSGKVFSSRQLEIANAEFDKIKDKLISEKGKLTNPEEIAKAEELLAKLEEIRGLYSSNVVAEKPKESDNNNTVLKNALGKTLDGISTPTSLINGNIDGIKYSPDNGRLTLGNTQYDVKLSYKGFSFNLSDAIIDADNVTFKVKVPIIGEQVGSIPKENLTKMMGDLIDNGSAFQEAKGGKLEITKVA